MDEIPAIRNANKLAGIEWPTKKKLSTKGNLNNNLTQAAKQKEKETKHVIMKETTQPMVAAKIQQKLRHPREQVKRKWEKPKCSQEIVAAKKRQRQNNCERCWCRQIKRLKRHKEADD